MLRVGQQEAHTKAPRRRARTRRRDLPQRTGQGGIAATSAVAVPTPTSSPPLSRRWARWGVNHDRLRVRAGARRRRCRSGNHRRTSSQVHRRRHQSHRFDEIRCRTPGASDRHHAFAAQQSGRNGKRRPAHRCARAKQRSRLPPIDRETLSVVVECDPGRGLAATSQHGVDRRYLGTVPMPLNAQEFAAFIAAESEKWGKVVRIANIAPQ